MNQDERIARMRALVDSYEAALRAGEPANARDGAYEMLQVLSGLYAAAYTAAALQAGREGKAG